MKYVFLLAAVAVVYYFLSRSAPIAPVVKTVTAQEAAPLTTGPRNPPPAASSTALKRPLDRTHAVLDQVKARNGNGEF